MQFGEERGIYTEKPPKVAADKSISTYTVEVISSLNDFDRIGSEWRSLTEQVEVTIFQTHEWLRTWWSHFGGHGELHIITVRYEGRLVGILPLFIDTYKLFRIPVYRCLRMIGSQVMQPQGGSLPVELAFSDYLDLIALSQHARKVIEHIVIHLKMFKRDNAFNEVLLEEIPENSDLYTGIIQFMSGNNWICEVTGASKCPVLPFPESWEEYLQSQSRNSRYKIRSCLRKVEHGAEFKCDTSIAKKDIEGAFDKLVTFHQQRWNNLGQSGIFADNRILTFFKDITMQFMNKNWLWIEKLKAGDQTVAVDLMFVYKGRIYLIQRGFDDRSPVINQGPGNILLYHIFRTGIDRKMKMYDFLRGLEDYKLRLTDQIIQNKTIFMRDGESERFFRKLISSTVRRYVHLKRKLRNEQEVIHVHLYKKPHLKGIAQYLVVTCSRLFKRIF